ncbi:transglutaminase-like cysteine peptidase [Cellvibrio sp. NN19]|uniref:transglutaminase-like cysteine peptidase n=1 Tax=Cellvibrio chitinivorans TaxID=3102792 RepID=UPI002B40F61D|nr:transglutaminase-like cysteine peptidase [Cellvibrio sp. NN19]
MFLLKFFYRYTFFLHFNSKFLLPYKWLLLLLSTSLLVSADINPQKLQSTMSARYGNDGVALLSAWQRMLENANSLTNEEKLAQVNQFFNRNIRYTEDSILWKKSDYWATPLETMGMRAGDCEDYTIAKYLSLLELGVPNEQLRLIYVKAQIGGPQSRVSQAHMVLGYYPTPNSIPLILDSLVNSIDPANKRSDLHPVFSFNSAGLWVGNQATQADPTARLSRWRDLLARVKEEGF